MNKRNAVKNLLVSLIKKMNDLLGVRFGCRHCAWLILFCWMVFPVTILQARYLPLDVEIPRSTEPIKISSGAAIDISGRWSPPITAPDYSRQKWAFDKRETRPATLAGMHGKTIRDYFRTDGLTLCREVWVSDGQDVFAVRQRVTNRSRNAIRLQAMYPLDCEGPADFRLGRTRDVSQWNILSQQRRKNDRPGTRSPDGHTHLEAEQFCLIRPKTEAGEFVLLLGYVSWQGHLSHILADFSDQNGHTQLEFLRTECELDNVALPPGGERTSQWVYLRAGDEANALIRDYANQVGVYHGVTPPDDTPPAVFCSWYFHGPRYSEELLKQDLQALQENPMPFDVFLIDECWSLGQWGDFEAVDSWPAGMKSAAHRIRAAGYTPGIWSCPYLVDFGSDLARAHPEWLLKNRNGDRITFPMNDVDHWILDPTFPGVCDFLEATYRKLSQDWGYDYFKFDFMRAVFLDTGQQFHDQTKTRLEAYRMGLEAIRLGTGPNAYLSVCGGHYGGSLGLANSQRSGSDVVSYWDANQIPKYRQNILRTWMSRLWHVDPDAMMVRNREQPYYPDRNLSLGKFSLEEAETNALNQYIGGGIVTFTEFMPELGSERKALYRHVIPSLGSTSVPLDIFNHHCPRYMLTYVRPRCETLEPWVTVSIVNWGEEMMKPEVQLSSRVTGHIQADRYLVCEFFSQKVLGIYDKDQSITLEELPPHQSYILHISPWTGETPVLAGTDLHYSGGGVEIAEWDVKNETVQGKIETRWDYPVRVTVAFPNRTEPGSIGAVKTIELPKGQQKFTLSQY